MMSLPLNIMYGLSIQEKDHRKKTSAGKRCKRLQEEKRQLIKKAPCMRRQQTEMRKLRDKSRKLERRLIEREKVGLSEKIKKRGSKYCQQRDSKQQSIFCAEMKTVTFQLRKKKDTITKNKLKMQKTVLTKSLTELHAQCQTEVEQHLSMSYKQSVRQQPFYIIESKTTG